MSLFKEFEKFSKIFGESEDFPTFLKNMKIFEDFGKNLKNLKIIRFFCNEYQPLDLSTCNSNNNYPKNQKLSLI
jgi:hypothetical protein